MYRFHRENRFPLVKSPANKTKKEQRLILGSPLSLKYCTIINK